MTEGNEAARPEARAKKVVEEAFCRSESVRATKRRRRIFSLGRCHARDRGERSLEARARTERGGRGSLLLFCASASDQTSETYILPREMSRSDRGVRGLTESRSSHRKKMTWSYLHVIFLCERRDSNPYARRHQILSLAWLPITTRSQNPSEDS